MGQIAYKGFDKKLRCRGFQFEIGGTYEEDKAELGKCGFHAYLRPLDVIHHYHVSNSRYCLVELDDMSDERRSKDTTVCARKIKVVKELSVSDLVEEQKWYDGGRKRSRAGVGGLAVVDDLGVATAGLCGAAVAGDHGLAAAENGGIALAGCYGTAKTGSRGVATARMNGFAVAYNSGIATVGGCGVAVSRGKSKAGADGIAVARGNHVAASGAFGAVIVIVEEEYDGYGLIEWKAGIIDGKTLKPYTWYKLKNGEFVEAEGEENV